MTGWCRISLDFTVSKVGVLEISDHFTIRDPAEISPRGQIDVFTDEANAPIAQGNLNTADMHASRRRVISCGTATDTGAVLRWLIRAGVSAIINIAQQIIRRARVWRVADMEGL